jgi:hypothetical protein
VTARKPTAKKPKPKAKTGRPSLFSVALAADLCSRIAGGKSLRTVCEAEDMPDKATVFRWLGDDASFRDQYACAREAQADSIADEMLDIADDKSLDPNDRRVRLDTRKWLASKLRPKKYGERLELAGDKENPLAVVHEAGKTLDAKLERFIARGAGGPEGKPDA